MKMCPHNIEAYGSSLWRILPCQETSCQLQAWHIAPEELGPRCCHMPELQADRGHMENEMSNQQSIRC